MKYYKKNNIFKTIKKLLGLSGLFGFLLFTTCHPILHNHPLVIGSSWKSGGNHNYVIKSHHGEFHHKHHKFCPACHFLTLCKFLKQHSGCSILLTTVLTKTPLPDKFFICQTTLFSINNRSPPV